MQGNTHTPTLSLPPSHHCSTATAESPPQGLKACRLGYALKYTHHTIDHCSGAIENTRVPLLSPATFRNYEWLGPTRLWDATATAFR